MKEITDNFREQGKISVKVIDGIFAVHFKASGLLGI